MYLNGYHDSKLFRTSLIIVTDIINNTTNDKTDCYRLSYSFIVVLTKIPIMIMSLKCQKM